MSTPKEKQLHWFVMRDLKRSNAKLPAYKLLTNLNIINYTPMRTRMVVKQNKTVREKVPFIQDLLFVYADKQELDLIVAKTPTLQYRFQKGKKYCEPMIVADDDMKRFIHAVQSVDTPQYFMPSEITPAMYGKEVRIIGGNLDGYIGRLLSIRGTRKKHLLIELPSWFIAAVEVDPEYVQLI